MSAMVLAAAVLAAAPQTALPDWLAGCWTQTSGDEWTEECWTTARAGVMLGTNRAGKGDRLTMWETMQILPDDATAAVFWASPRGAARSAFPMVSAGPREIVFANAAHDYPQRIRYWREGPVLNAEISLIDGRQPMRWRFRQTPRR